MFRSSFSCANSRSSSTLWISTLEYWKNPFRLNVNVLENASSVITLRSAKSCITTPLRAGDSRSLEGLEMAFYCTAKTVRGGRSNLVGFIPYIYWTQKTLSVYLAPWGKNWEYGFYIAYQILRVILISILHITPKLF